MAKVGLLSSDLSLYAVKAAYWFVINTYPVFFLLILDQGTYENQTTGLKKQRKPKRYLLHVSNPM